ncbi:MAG TPA: hypothetical protein VMM13_15970 [Euzebya sp.]|nr:hypothetical protein [Euzebya sp.]
MIGLLHYMTHLPGPAPMLLAVLGGPPSDWLGGTELDERHHMLCIRPDGLLADPDATVEVVVGLGPCTAIPGGLLRRLSFKVGEDTPEVRCDLEITTAKADGCRMRLRGDYRPSLAADAAAVAETVEAVARPLVEGIADRVSGSTLPV